MVNNQVHNALLYLLQTGLWGEQELGNEFPLSAKQWRELYVYAQKHTIEGIVLDGIQFLPSALFPPRDLLMKWMVRIDQIERRNQEMNRCIQEQLSFFNAHQLKPVLLKGQGVASLYARPDHRICGDIDWYFEGRDHYLKARTLLKEKGLYINDTAGFSSAYLWRNVLTEHHTRMFDIHNPLSFSFLDRLQKQYRPVQLKNAETATGILIPAPIMMALQVNVHILKHLLSFGVGLRQLCDSAQIYLAFKDEIDGLALKKIYKTLGILKWVHLLHAVLVKFLGLPVAYLPFELPKNINADWMMDEILKSGNFGFYYGQTEKELQQPAEQRSQASYRVWSNVRRYFRFAPMEALSFPFVQVYSKLALK